MDRPAKWRISSTSRSTTRRAWCANVMACTSTVRRRSSTTPKRRREAEAAEGLAEVLVVDGDPLGRSDVDQPGESESAVEQKTAQVGKTGPRLALQEIVDRRPRCGQVAREIRHSPARKPGHDRLVTASDRLQRITVDHVVERIQAAIQGFQRVILGAHGRIIIFRAGRRTAGAAGCRDRQGSEQPAACSRILARPRHARRSSGISRRCARRRRSAGYVAVALVVPRSCTRE